MKKIYFYLFLLISLANKISAQTLFNDPFDGSVLNSNWFIINPNPAGEVRLTGSGELLMHASAQNGGSDIYASTNFNAPQMYQAVDTADHNWLVETKVRFNCTNDYQAAGIDLHISSDPHDSAAAIRIIEKQYSPLWQGASILGVQSVNNVYTDSIIYLRCGRSTDSIRVWYSADSSTWNFLGAIADTPIYYVGLFSVRQPWDNDTTIDSYAYFDYFLAGNATGIADVPIEMPAVKVFPNPSDGRFTLSGINTGQQIEIYNSLGQRVLGLKEVGLQPEINLSSMADGIYILRISTPESLIERKLVKIKD